MRLRFLIAGLAAAAAAPAAQAQDNPDTGVRTETQERMTAERDPNLPWNIIGLLGLFGLLGLRREHPDDSYHPANVD
jgi:hypothetical protein